MLTATAKKGVRATGALITLAEAGAANTGNLFQLSNYGQQIGTKTARIKRLKVANYAGGDIWLYIGTGTGGTFAQAMPRLRVVNGFNGDFGEDDLPEAEFAADITVYTDVATVEVQAEVEETG